MKFALLIMGLLMTALAGCISESVSGGTNGVFPPSATSIIDLGNGYYTYHLQILDHDCFFMVHSYTTYGRLTGTDTTLLNRCF